MTSSRPKIDKRWNQGDFLLVSSDSIGFMIPSYYLYAARWDFWWLKSLIPSGVFRGAKSLATGELRAELCDDYIETSDIVRLFLHLATEGKVVGEGEVKHRLPALAQFLVKYECNMAMVSLVQHAFTLCDSDPVIAYTVGAVMENLELCKSALGKWNGRSRNPLVKALDYQAFLRIPNPYLYALLHCTQAFESAAGLCRLEKVLEETTCVAPSPERRLRVG